MDDLIVSRKPWDDVWKWIAIGMTGAFFGLLLGQYTPNRNIVTTDQLNQHIATETQSFGSINEKLDTITDYVNQQKGAEAARLALSKDQRREDPR